MAITGKSSCAHDFFFFFACASPATHATRWTTKSVGEHPIQTMPFGKNKGVPLTDLPDHYLPWILRQTWLKPPLERALVAEYRRRLVDLSDEELQRRIDGAHRPEWSGITAGRAVEASSRGTGFSALTARRRRRTSWPHWGVDSGRRSKGSGRGAECCRRRGRPRSAGASRPRSRSTT